MDRACLLEQHWPDDRDPLRGPRKQIPTWDQEVRTGQHRELLGRERVDDRPNPCPVHLAGAHGAGLTACVERGALELIGAELLDSKGDQIGFGMPGRIPSGHDRVGRGQNDLLVEDQKGAEGVVSLAAGLMGESDGTTDERSVGISRGHTELNSGAGYDGPGQGFLMY